MKSLMSVSLCLAVLMSCGGMEEEGAPVSSQPAALELTNGHNVQFGICPEDGGGAYGCCVAQGVADGLTGPGAAAICGLGWLAVSIFDAPPEDQVFRITARTTRSLELRAMLFDPATRALHFDRRTRARFEVAPTATSRFVLASEGLASTTTAGFSVPFTCTDAACALRVTLTYPDGQSRSTVLFPNR